MPVTKHALIRYQALDRCFRARGKQYFWEDLLEAVNEALSEFTGKAKGISRRQLFEDIKYMESDQGWSIPLKRHAEGKRVWYRYSDVEFSINKRPLNEDEADQLKEALLTLSRFKGMPQFQWVDGLVARLEAAFDLRKGAERVIEFQENPYLKGMEHITPLFHAILEQQVIAVTYQGFKQHQPTMLRFHPHYLKQYNNRWFVFGSADGKTAVTNLPLDRIQQITPAKGKYLKSIGIDYAEYFDDVIGVTVPETSVVDVIVRVSPKLWPYLSSKPLHGSQTVIERSGGGGTLRLQVKTNFELQSALLSHGEELEVISPSDLRKTIADRAKAMVRNYEE